MDKGRHPKVVRTWTVERIREQTPRNQPRTGAPRVLPRAPRKNPPAGGSGPNRGD